MVFNLLADTQNKEYRHNRYNDKISQHIGLLACLTPPDAFAQCAGSLNGYPVISRRQSFRATLWSLFSYQALCAAADTGSR